VRKPSEKEGKRDFHLSVFLEREGPSKTKGGNARDFPVLRGGVGREGGKQSPIKSLLNGADSLG